MKDSGYLSGLGGVLRVEITRKEDSIPIPDRGVKKMKMMSTILLTLALGCFMATRDSFVFADSGARRI